MNKPGRPLGSTHPDTDARREKIRALVQSGVSPKTIAAQLGVSLNTVYRLARS